MFKKIEGQHYVMSKPNIHGVDEDWLHINCSNILSGINYAISKNIKRIVFMHQEKPEIDASRINLDFFNELLDLEGLCWLPYLPKQFDLSIIEKLTKLKSLELSNLDLHLNLKSFRNLEYLGVNFPNRLTGYEFLDKLESLRISKFSGDLSLFSEIKNLKKLGITSSNITSLSGIETLKNLKSLNLVGLKKLTDISDISKSKSITEFSAEKIGPISNFSALKNNNYIQSVWLMMKSIDSCEFISSMGALEFFSCNAIISDGNLSPVLEAKALQEIYINPMKRNYYPAHAVEKVKALMDTSSNEIDDVLAKMGLH